MQHDIFIAVNKWNEIMEMVLTLVAHLLQVFAGQNELFIKNKFGWLTEVFLKSHSPC